MPLLFEDVHYGCPPGPSYPIPFGDSHIILPSRIAVLVGRCWRRRWWWWWSWAVGWSAPPARFPSSKRLAAAYHNQHQWQSHTMQHDLNNICKCNFPHSIRNFIISSKSFLVLFILAKPYGMSVRLHGVASSVCCSRTPLGSV